MATPRSPSIRSSEQESFEQLKTERDTLINVIHALEHKAATQTGQVVGCEKKVTKVMNELAEVRAAAEKKELYSQSTIARLQTRCDILEHTIDVSAIKVETQTDQVQGCERLFVTEAGGELAEIKAAAQEMEAQLQRIIQTLRRSIEHSQTPIGHVKGLEGEWTLPVSLLEDELAVAKKILSQQEQTIPFVKDENLRLRQAARDLKAANQDLKRKYTQTVCNADKDQGSVTGSYSGEVIKKERSMRPLEREPAHTYTKQEPIDIATDTILQALAPTNPPFAEQAALPDHQGFEASYQQAIAWLNENIA